MQDHVQGTDDIVENENRQGQLMIWPLHARQSKKRNELPNFERGKE